MLKEFSSLFSLEGKVALVTGGSRGIGRMIAEGFVRQGARVYIAARNEEHCRETAAALGERCIALPADLSHLEGIRALAEAFGRLEPQLDILVNNAGAAWGAPFEEFPEKGWDRIFSLNVKAPFFLAQALHPLLKRGAQPDRPAKIIQIGSIDGIRPGAWDNYSYQAAKAALHHLTRKLAARLIRDGIVVSAIAPGAFPSDMNRVARDRAEEYARAIPAGRIGTPEDIAAAAIYLASRAGDYVVGETIAVDGGATYASPNALPEI